MNTSTFTERSHFLTPSRRPAPLIVVAVVAVLIVCFFGAIVVPTAGLSSWDTAVSHSFNLLHTGAIGVLSTTLYFVFEPPFAVGTTVILCAVLFLATRNVRLAVSFGAVIAITWVPTVVVKVLVHRPRPNPLSLAHPFTVQPDASYPSGHMAFVTALVVTLILLAGGRRSQWLVALLGSLLIVVLGTALLIDGVHFPTDVMASIVWSAGVAPCVLFLWTRVAIPLTHRSAFRTRLSR